MIKALTEDTKHPAAVMLGRLGGLKTSPKKRRAQRKNLEKGRRILARKRKAARKMDVRLSNGRYEYEISPGKWVSRQYLDQRRFPERALARRLVTKAVKAGRLCRQPCEVCGTALTEAHHDDYTKPLSVRWLCPQHHQEQHRPK